MGMYSFCIVNAPMLPSVNASKVNIVVRNIKTIGLMFFDKNESEFISDCHLAVTWSGASLSAFSNSS